MSDRIAVIGDDDVIFAFKALGFKTYSPENVEEARRMLAALEEEDVALCFLHEKYFEPLREERKALEKKLCPVVVVYSDFKTVTDYLGNMIREMAIKATGSDSLVRRRGKDETR